MTLRQSKVKVKRSKDPLVYAPYLITPNTLLNIHEFAQLCRTTPRTIRFYDINDLLKPIKIDPITKYRYYQQRQAREYFKIKLLQNFRVPLKEMSTAVKKYSEDSFLQSKLDIVTKEIEEKQKELTFLKNIKAFLFGDNPEKFLKFENHGPFTLFTLLVEDGRYDRINADLSLLFDLAKKFNLPVIDKQVITYLDPDAYRPKDTRLEISLVCNKRPTEQIIKKIQGENKNISITYFPKVRALTYTYKGPFEYLTFIHKKMYEFVMGKKRHANPFDIHTKGPWNEKSPYNYVSKVGYPIEE